MASPPKHAKIKLREVNRHLVCRLCRGYYVDATTIAECLHSFCRSCIIKYLEKNSFCPICEVQIHKTKPYLNLRLDKALQDVVYKVVPGLYHDEMKRRRKFYSKHREQIPTTTPEQCGLEERIIFSPEDSISLSLEYLESDDCDSETLSSRSSESGDNPEGLSFPQQLGLMKLKNNEGRVSRRESQDVPETSSFHKRYLRCPAVVNISHLKKFIRMKHELTDKMQVDIIHKRVPLPDHYTLMDVAYIYTWKRSSPLRFFYQIYQTKRQKLPPGLPEAAESKSEEARQETDPVKEASAGGNLQNGETEQLSLERSQPKKATENPPAGKTPSGVDGKHTGMKNAAKGGEAQRSEQSARERSKSDATAKPEAVGGGVNGVRSGTEGKPAESKKVTEAEKSDKSDPKSGGAGASVPENKNKTECPNKKSSKAESGGGSREAKENRSRDWGRVLLDPISGQLEPVPSTDRKAELADGPAVPADETNGSAKSRGRESGVGEGNKSQAECAKGTKKSSVNLLKSFRKDKSKVEVKAGKGNCLTITAVPRGDKPAEKPPSQASVEIKADAKASEYDFDGGSAPSKIIPLQEFSKFSKNSKYLSDHREKWLSKEAGNDWMSLQDFRQRVLKQDNSSEDLSKRHKRKSVPSLYKIGVEASKKSARNALNGKGPADKEKGRKNLPTIINIQTEGQDQKPEIKIQVPRKEARSPPRPIKIENRGGEFSIKPHREEKSSRSVGGEAPRGTAATTAATIATAVTTATTARTAVTTTATWAKTAATTGRGAATTTTTRTAATTAATTATTAKTTATPATTTAVTTARTAVTAAPATTVTTARTTVTATPATTTAATTARTTAAVTEKTAVAAAATTVTGKTAVVAPVVSVTAKTAAADSAATVTAKTAVSTPAAAETSQPPSETLEKPQDEKPETDTRKESPKPAAKSNSDGESPSNSNPSEEESKNENCGAIDLSKAETGLKSKTNPPENPGDSANQTGSPKNEEKVAEAVISAVQKQNVEPLLKIPQYSQNLKNSQASPPLAKNLSPNDFNQALQFFRDLRSDLKVLEGKNPLGSNSASEQTPKSANLEPLQLYQQHIDLIRRLKRQCTAAADGEGPPRKQTKLSPTSEPKERKSPVQDQYSITIDRTYSHLHDMNRSLAVQAFKNFPPFLQYYGRSPGFCPAPTSPSKAGQQKPKPANHSPSSGKSPPNLTSPSGSLSLPMSNSDAAFFNSQNYNHLVNAGLSSEMTFHQMFQNYLHQQDKMNQIKHSPGGAAKKPAQPPAKPVLESYYSPPAGVKKSEGSSSVAAAQKT